MYIYILYYIYIYIYVSVLIFDVVDNLLLIQIFRLYLALDFP